MRPVFFFLSFFFLPVDGHTQEGLLVSVALIAVCQACSSSHTQDTHERRRTGAYRTLNKRGRIPDVFPHEVTSCSRGRAGCWESTGVSAREGRFLRRRTYRHCLCFPPLPLPPLRLWLHYLHLSIHLRPSSPSSSPTQIPLPASLIPPAGISRLDLKLCSNICRDAKLERGTKKKKHVGIESCRRASGNVRL